jgi:uncharacterized protein
MQAGDNSEFSCQPEDGKNVDRTGKSTCMKKEQIDKLIYHCGLPDSCENVQLHETHISWVILTDRYAFKIKKPVKLSFVDFSTPGKRKHFCREEVELNRRLSPDMYLDVIPVTSGMTGRKNAGSSGHVIDYSVQMKRMDNQLMMEKMLAEGRVERSHLDKLAQKIGHFHRHARVIKNAFDTIGFQELYRDIEHQLSFIREEVGDEWAVKIRDCIDRSNRFLNSSRSYFNQRIISGFRRDCHGDLNAGNIFLYDDPVIFDCIEFNDQYRFIDVLNEIAFLCVDLDFYGYEELSEAFYRKYLEAYGTREDESSRRLLMYYKSYRANIRAKVISIATQQEGAGNENPEAIRKFIDLMDSYSRAHGDSAIPGPASNRPADYA